MHIVRGYFDKSRVGDYNKIINESFVRSRSFSDKKVHEVEKPTVFISHKHSDLKDLEGFLSYLTEKYKVEPYIDSMDHLMPNMTNAETAIRIKNVIESCDRFILLATNAALLSKWCNWEVGIADKSKYLTHNMAILPMYERGGNRYEGNEYLGIYPYIDEEIDENGNKILVVKYISNNKQEQIPLKDWLKLD